jgi:hydroxypyruvate isomerase
MRACFANHAGKNFLDQIQYMYDQGFRSIEDNGYLGRPIEEQKKIGDLLAKLGMRMGVFCGRWWRQLENVPHDREKRI